MIIAIDFDDTLAKQDTDGNNYPYTKLIEKLINLRKKGHKLILWTCRGGEWLQEAVDFCKSYGLEFDAINKNIPGYYREISCKVVADIYVDDKNISIDNFLTKDI